MWIIYLLSVSLRSVSLREKGMWKLFYNLIPLIASLRNNVVFVLVLRIVIK